MNEKNVYAVENVYLFLFKIMTEQSQILSFKGEGKLKKNGFGSSECIAICLRQCYSKYKDWYLHSFSIELQLPLQNDRAPRPFIVHLSKKVKGHPRDLIPYEY